MSESPAPLLTWPCTVDKTRDLLVIAVATPATQLRDTARQHVRGVLREVLGDIELVSAPGQAIRPARADCRIGISVSHESGLSLVAINFSGPVGVDLLRLPENRLGQSEASTLAGDYLGPDVARRISELPPAESLVRFAEAWTQHEASLKSLSLGLSEWNPGLAEKLRPCQTQKLALPPPYFGTVATLRADESRAV